MALRLIDGFDYYPSSGLSTVVTAQGWTGATGSIVRSTNNAFGYGYSMGLSSNNNNDVIQRSLRGRYTGVGVLGMRMFVPSNGPGYSLSIVDSMTSSGNRQWRLHFLETGNIDLYVGNNVLTARTDAMSYTPGKWFYLEIKWTPSLITGTFEVRINTVPVLTLPSIQTAYGTVVGGGASGFDTVEFWKSSISGALNSWAWDDLYFLDTTGSVNNDYLGNVRVKAQLPVSDYSVQFAIGGTAPASTNWQSVLNTALNDTKYVYTPTAGYKDLYDIDPILNTPLVHGIEISGAYRQDDATQRFIKNSIQSSGVNAEGVSRAINQSYTFYADIFETDPNTGVSFTGTAANALKIGPKVDV